MSNILGISAYYHDSAACLLREGKILAAAQEERFSRLKHDPSFPAQAMRYCLEEGGISGKDLDLVVFYDKPFLKFERILETFMAFAPRGITPFIRSMPLWLKKKLWMKDQIRDELDSEVQILFPEHHESHAASAFFPSPFKEAAILTMDGVGEWVTTSFGTGRDNHLEIHSDIHFPHSIGLLYSAFTYYTGFRVNSGEYKLMGLAPYGEPVYSDLILDKIIDLKDDGSFRLDLSYFNYCTGLTMTSRRFHNQFGGPPRKPESKITKRHMDLARSIQAVTEEVILRMTRHVFHETGMKNLVLAGGVALNCVGNGRILREGPFDDLWIQPAAGDAGGALGAALFAYHQYLGNERRSDGSRDSQGASYLGPSFKVDVLRKFLEERKAPYREISEDELPSVVADLIAGENVIGWFQGRMEFGPRALGARSIIGDPRSPEMQERMNLKIKFRESFRPFAPSVLEEEAAEYFALDRPSPYMLLVAPVHDSKRRRLSAAEDRSSGFEALKTVRSEIPAVTHVDHSARVQTVRFEDNPLYHKLIRAFKDRHGCPLVVNTSFNVRGEPIVCTPENAFDCFLKTGMDYLVLGPFLIDKKEMQV